MYKIFKKVIGITLVSVALLGSVASASPLQSAQDKLGTDKVAHFGVGFIVEDTLQKHTKMTPFERFMTVSTLAVVKEGTDDKFDRNDIFSTMLGAGMLDVSHKF